MSPVVHARNPLNTTSSLSVSRACADSSRLVSSTLSFDFKSLPKRRALLTDKLGSFFSQRIFGTHRPRTSKKSPHKIHNPKTQTSPLPSMMPNTQLRSGCVLVLQISWLRPTTNLSVPYIMCSWLRPTTNLSVPYHVPLPPILVETYDESICTLEWFPG